MARSAINDPVEKFRFKMSVFSFNTSSPLGTTDANQDQDITGGFSSISLPKATVKEIRYRENVDPNRRRKVAGLVDFEPVVCRKGVTKNRQLYNWYKKVNDDIDKLSAVNGLLAAQNFVPILSPDYRRDILIQSLDRESNTVRAWYLFDAFPTAYQGGDGLDASAEGKLIEEITLTYEAFVEIPDASLATLNAENFEAQIQAIAAGALSSVVIGF